MSAREVINLLSAAKQKLEGAQSAAASAAQAAADAEQHVARALEGVGGDQLVAQLSDVKASLGSTLAKIAPAKAELDKAIQRTQAIGGGY